MFTVAALFRPQGLTYGDFDDRFVISKTSASPGAEKWEITVPKDGMSDMWRFQEAVEQKTRAGKGLVIIPHLEIEGPSSQPYFRYKEVWDRKSNIETTHVWGGSFVTEAFDYDNGEEYEKLDLQQVPHYYNILLTVREKREFEVVNPGLEYVWCEKGCLPRRHYHGVHGLYPGAVLDPDFVEGKPVLEPRYTAPPLSILKGWNELRPFNTDEVKVPVLEAESSPGNKDISTQATPKNTIMAQARGLITVSGGRNPTTESVGARALKDWVSTPPRWNTLVHRYRSPHTATWADPALLSGSERGQDNLRQQWNAEYNLKVLPLMRGDGIPVDQLVRKISSLDNNAWKVKASYFLRRLAAGNSGIVPTKSFKRVYIKK